MATNMVYKNSDQIPVTLTVASWPLLAAGASAGDAVCIGAVTGVALTDAAATVGETVIRRKGVFSLEVGAFDDDVNDPGAAQAITAGDSVYINVGTGNINVNDAAVHFGYALEDVAAGTATIRVLLR